MSDKCNDCGNEPGEVIKGESAQIGLYYEGPAICESCAEDRYENAWVDYEDDIYGRNQSTTTGE